MTKWLWKLGWGFLFLSLGCSVAYGQALHLFTETKTYQAGKPINVYAYFYRVGEAGMFSSWGKSIQSNSDFQVSERKRISGIREGDIFGPTQFHLLYRVQIVPKNNGNTLSYGPIVFQNVQSNQLIFQKATTLDPSVSVEMNWHKKSLSLGQSMRIQYKVRCPRALCQYQNIQSDQLVQHFSQKTKFVSSSHFSRTSQTLNPSIQYGNNETILQFEASFVPVQSGFTTVPSLDVNLPVLKTLYQGRMVAVVQKWLKDTHKIPLEQSRNWLQVRRNVHRFVAFQQVRSTSSRKVEIVAAKHCPGSWQLESKIVNITSTSSPVWKVSLHGNGFLLLAQNALRSQLEKVFQKHRLEEQAKLLHIVWKVPEGDLSKHTEVTYYFKLLKKKLNLPSFSMSFVNAQGKVYTRKVGALSSNQVTGSQSDSLTLAANEKKIYVTAPQKMGSQEQMISVYGYQLPDSFPTQEVLSSMLSWSGGLSLEATQKMKTITQRQSRNQGMGFFQMVSSRTIPIPVLTGDAMGKKKSSPLAGFPLVFWKGEKVGVEEMESKSLSFSARTNRAKYFVGETIEYIVSVVCSKQDCPEKSKGFYSNVFKAALKKPDFSKIGNWKEMESFKRHDRDNDSVEFRYVVSFQAPSSGTLDLSASRLELSQSDLTSLLNKHQICLFRGGNGEDQVLSQILRNHRGVQDGGNCHTETQELSTVALKIQVEELPSNAQNVKLIGSFQIQSSFENLSFPRKQSTEADKPFYWLVDISGDGDLLKATDLMKDQISLVLKKLAKESITGYQEVVNDSSLKSKGIVRIQVQLIAEQKGQFEIPSLKLPYYHREEGLLTAQTLPLTFQVESRTGLKVVKQEPTKSKETTPKTQKREVLQASDLRPNQVWNAKVLVNDWVDWRASKEYWISLLFSPLLFLFSFLFYRKKQRLALDPQLEKQQKSWKNFQKSISQLSSPSDKKEWSRSVLHAIQSYFHERLRLEQKNITTKELKKYFVENSLSEGGQKSLQLLLKQMEALEESLYGGQPIAEPKSFLRSLEDHLKELQKCFAKEGGIQ